MSGARYERHVRAELEAALEHMPVVLIAGARQVGKSTLAQQIAGKREFDHLSLDNATTWANAIDSPESFVSTLDLPVVIDEIQRAPDLFLPIKLIVDDRRYRALTEGGPPAAGLFLLTGSASIWHTLRIPDSLAGRIARLPLWPLSQGELRRVRETFIDDLFAGRPPKIREAKKGRAAVSELMVQGGYPEAVELKDPKLRASWFDAYIDSIVARDVRDLSNVREPTQLPRLLKLLASRVGGLVNLAGISNDLEMSQATLARYFELLEMTYVVNRVPAWRRNVGQRLIKSPKIWLCDSGLACHLVGYDAKRIETDETSLAGNLFENFVGVELLKQASWSKTRVTLHHYRTAGGTEVDIVLEDAAGDVCGVEVKLSASLDRRDWRGLEHLRDKLGDRFRAGVVLYTGAERLPLGDRLWALPVSALWTPA